MTTPKVKCDICNYEGEALVDVWECPNRWVCCDCGKDELTMLLLQKIENGKSKT